MKQFTGNTYFRGIQYNVTFCTDSINTAAKLMNCTTYNIKTYYYCNEPRDSFAIDNKEKIYAMVDGGELCQLNKNIKFKWMPIEQMKNIIINHRLKYASYHEVTKEINNRLIDIIDTTNEPNILQIMKWGGTRKGSGAKPKYKCKTKVVCFRCPIDKEIEFRDLANSKLKEWQNK